MANQPAASFKAFLTGDPHDNDGKRNTGAFTNTLDDADKANRIKALAKDIKSVFFAADNSRKIHILHSPSNFRGTRMCLANKVVALMGLGPKGMAVIID